MTSRGRLWWLHLLVALTLTGSGAGAGLTAYWARDWPQVQALSACLTDHGIDPGAEVVQPADRLAMSVCTADWRHQQALAMLTGAGATWAGAWLLLIGSAWLTRRRSARAEMPDDSPVRRAAAARFEQWVERCALPDRGRPRLVLADPGSGFEQAVTTTLPWARPVVVLPAGYAYGPADRLDLVTAHELAHVRTADLTWAGLTWWAGWLLVPQLVVAAAPVLLTTRPQTSTWLPLTATVMAAAATVTLRALVLRRRELDADRYAVRLTGRPEVLDAALASGRHGRPGGPVGLLSSHPSATARSMAVRGGTGSTGRSPDEDDLDWQLGVVAGAVSGTVAGSGYAVLAQVLSDLPPAPWQHAAPGGDAFGDPRIPGDLALGAAALLWAVLLVPLWAHRRSGGPPWRSMLAASAALGVSLALPVPVFPLLAVQSRLATWYGGHLLAAVVVSTAVALGAAAVGAGLAADVRRAPTENRRRLATVAAVLATAVTAAAGLGVATIVAAIGSETSSQAPVRVAVVEFGSPWWAAAPLLLLLAALTSAVATRSDPAPGPLPGPGPRRTLVVATAAVLAGSLVSIVVTERRVLGGDAAWTLLVQRWWVAGASGWTTALLVLAVAGTSGRRTRFAHLLLAGGAAAAATGLLQFASAALLEGADDGPGTAISFVTHPLHLTFLLLVLTLPLALAARPLAATAAGRAGRARLWSSSGRAAGTAGLATATAAVLIMSGLLAPVTVAAGDAATVTALSRAPAPGATPAPVSAAASPAGPSPAAHASAGAAPAGSDPGRLLDVAQAEAILATAATVLPPGWSDKNVSAGAAPAQDVQPSTCAARFAADDRADRARARSADRRRDFEVAHALPRTPSLTATLTSYRDPAAAAAALEDLTATLRDCPQFRFTLPTSGQTLQVVERRTLEDGGTARRPAVVALITQQSRIDSTPITISFTLTRVAVGHNVVGVTVVHTTFGPATPASSMATIRRIRESVLDRLLTALSQ